MKSLLAWLFLVILTLENRNSGIDTSALTNVRKSIIQNSIGCTPQWNTLNISALANEMTPLPGSGNWTWKISTINDSAQFYFNQGINLYYGFHIIESVPSFRKAQQFDSACAILYWGEALALGPNINDIGYTASLEAKKAVDKAAMLLTKATPKEKQLVNAMKVRYSADSTVSQSLLNEKYASAMRGVYIQNEQDADIGSLLADALMLLHPWDFWQHDGTAKAWTPEIQTLLEKVIKKSPLHPGANHYYIHVVEASNNPGLAMKSADRLGSLAPSLSHLVHMPSHIYIRTGDFQKGILVNTEAVKGYNLYKSTVPAVADNVFLYEIHNRHMQVACAMNLNDFNSAITLAEDCRKSIPAEWMTLPDMGFYVQYIYLSPEFVMASFGKWDEILKQEEIADSLGYAKILQSFTKGLAYANKGEIQRGNDQLKKMEELMADTMLDKVLGPMNSPKSASLVARAILQGVLYEASGNVTQALASFSRAVEMEDAMIYNEPKDWLLPARGWLGEALLKTRDFEKAREVFETDLRKNPGSKTAKNGLIAGKKMKKAN